MKEQIRILKKSKNFLKEGHINDFNVSYNPNYFLSSWGESIGYLNIKNFLNKKISLFKKYEIIFKEFFSINKDNLKNDKDTIRYQYSNLIISYFFPENLKTNGTYDDRYFSTNTNFNKNTLWILIPLYKNSKNYKTKKNIVILKRFNMNKFINLFLSLIMFLKNFLATFGFRKLEKISFINSNFSESLNNIILNLIKNHKIKKIFFPYEAQPHQHYLINEIDKETKKISIIGYMHTVLPPLPLDYIKRDGHPHKILVNGLVQKNILCEKLGWNKNEVKNISSLRYKKKTDLKFEKTIFLPYFLEDEKKIFDYFKKLIFLKKKYFFPYLKIRNHPAMKKSKKHLYLESKLKNFIEKNSKIFKNSNFNNKICICLGSTASVIEGLERGYKVFHICSDPDLEKFQNYYWKNLKIYNYDRNIFEYKLKNKGKIIKLSSSKKNNFVMQF